MGALWFGLGFAGFCVMVFNFLVGTIMFSAMFFIAAALVMLLLAFLGAIVKLFLKRKK
nr:MAG TPA: hypothetical protein [Caudoviricetes sp.]